MRNPFFWLKSYNSGKDREGWVAVDGAVGHRNAYGKPRRASVMAATIVVTKASVRGLVERIEDRILLFSASSTEWLRAERE